jgi:hypothetical protein
MKLFFSLLLMMAASFPAHALRVGNCTDEPQSFIIDYYNDQVKIDLAPGQHRYFQGRPRELIKGNQVVTLFQIDNEYCIRSNGKIGLQRRNRRFGGKR